MSFALRLVETDMETDRHKLSPKQSAREILALVSCSSLDFQQCLRLCNMQSKLTPEFSYWNFAESHSGHFSPLFDTLKVNAHLEEGISLVNVFIMLVYLRLATVPGDSFVRQLSNLGLEKNNNADLNDLLSWVEAFATKIQIDRNLAPESSDSQGNVWQSVDLPDFQQKIQKILEK